MTGRERLLRTLNGQPTDRVPVSPFIHVNFVAEYVNDENADMIAETARVYRDFGFDIMHRNCSVGRLYEEVDLDSPNWRVTEWREDESDVKWSVYTKIRTPERELTQKRSFCRISPFEVVTATVEYLIKDEDDFAQFVKYQPPVPEYDCSDIRRAKEIVGDDGIVAPWIQGAFNSIGMYRDLNDLVVDPLLYPEMYEGMCAYFPARTRELARQCAAAGADILCAGGNMATGSMVGPDFYKSYILDMEREHTSAIQSYGTRYLYHNCGDAKVLIPLYSGVGMDAHESFTPPPYGDTDLEKALGIMDPKITMCGNIDQVDFLVTATPEEIRERVRDVLALAKKRGNFILATTDYFSNYTPHENIRALSDAGREFGAY